MKLWMDVADICDSLQAFQGIPHQNASLNDSAVAAAGGNIIPYVWCVHLFRLGDILKGFLNLQEQQQQ